MTNRKIYILVNQLNYMEKIGQAYGFFDCRASKQEIEAEIPTIRDLVRTPSQLELSLFEDPINLDNVNFSRTIDAGFSRSGKIGNSYLLKGNYPEADNGKAASEFIAIFNQLYQTPLYNHNEKFRGKIGY